MMKLDRVAAGGAGLMGLMLFGAFSYTACPVRGVVEGEPEEEAPQQTMQDLQRHHVLTFEVYNRAQNIILSPQQQQQLEQSGDLMGQIEMEVPVKFPNGRVQIPEGWLPQLPPGHPWHSPPRVTSPTFPAWFEARVLQPRLFDAENRRHQLWAEAYLRIVNGR